MGRSVRPSASANLGIEDAVFSEDTAMGAQRFSSPADSGAAGVVAVLQRLDADYDRAKLVASGDVAARSSATSCKTVAFVMSPEGSEATRTQGMLRLVHDFEDADCFLFALSNKAKKATGPLRQAAGPPRSGAGMGVGMVRGKGTT